MVDALETYSASQVAKVAGMTVSNFGMQFTRDHWRLFSNDRPENGHAHRFTLGQTMVYALARELAQSGFSAGDAFTTALHGLDQSSVDAYFGKIGTLFDESKGDTYFVAYPKIGNSAAHGLSLIHI